MAGPKNIQHKMCLYVNDATLLGEIATFCNPCNMVDILQPLQHGGNIAPRFHWRETSTVSPPASETLHPLSVIEVEVDVK